MSFHEFLGARRRIRRRIDVASLYVLHIPALHAWLRRRAIVAWLAAERPALVCKGNVCRSPFAAALVRQRLPHLDVIDAGTHGRPHDSPPPLAVEVASAYGVDLASHRPRRWQAGDARLADAVFVFDQRTWWRVVRASPSAIGRVHLFGLLADDAGSAVVDDPYGGERTAYEDTYARIVSVLDRATRSRGWSTP